MRAYRACGGRQELQQAQTGRKKEVRHGAVCFPSSFSRRDSWANADVSFPSVSVALVTHTCSFQIGHIDGEPSRKGAFPVSFVHFIAD